MAFNLDHKINQTNTKSNMKCDVIHVSSADKKKIPKCFRRIMC